MAIIPDAKSWTAYRARALREELEFKAQSRIGPIVNVSELTDETLSAIAASSTNSPPKKDRAGQ